jgi:ATP-binding protein involved in chromosome partitioning
MKIAVPMTEGSVSAHFGHCEKFAIFETTDKQVTNVRHLVPPAHEPGVFPKWLKEQGADVIIAGGMGSRAQDLFSSQGIQVISGVSADRPNELVKQYLEGNLTAGDNTCSH